jgi:hypothetical protein
MLERIGEILRRSGKQPAAAEPGAPRASEESGGRPIRERGRALLLVPDRGTARVIASVLRQANVAADEVGSPAALVTAAGVRRDAGGGRRAALPAEPPNRKRLSADGPAGRRQAAAQAGADAVFVLPPTRGHSRGRSRRPGKHL